MPDTLPSESEAFLAQMIGDAPPEPVMDVDDVVEDQDLGDQQPELPIDEPAPEPEISDEVRNRVISEYQQSHQAREQDQPQARQFEVPVKPTIHDCDYDTTLFSERLAEYYDAVNQQRFAEMQAMMMPMVEHQKRTRLDGLLASHQQAHPYVDAVLQEIGQTAASLTDQQAQWVAEIAIGKAVRAGKYNVQQQAQQPQTNYQAEPAPGNQSGAGRRFAAGMTSEDIAANEAFLGRRMSDAELKRMGIIL